MTMIEETNRIEYCRDTRQERMERILNRLRDAEADAEAEVKPRDYPREDANRRFTAALKLNGTVERIEEIKDGLRRSPGFYTANSDGQRGLGPAAMEVLGAWTRHEPLPNPPPSDLKSAAGEPWTPGIRYNPYIPNKGPRIFITRSMAAIREATGEPVAWEMKNPDTLDDPPKKDRDSC